MRLVGAAERHAVLFAACAAVADSLPDCRCCDAVSCGSSDDLQHPWAHQTLQVLEDVTEYEVTADGSQETHLEQILLNGNNIALLVPGGRPESS